MTGLIPCGSIVTGALVFTAVRICTSGVWRIKTLVLFYFGVRSSSGCAWAPFRVCRNEKSDHHVELLIDQSTNKITFIRFQGPDLQGSTLREFQYVPGEYIAARFWVSR